MILRALLLCLAWICCAQTAMAQVSTPPQQPGSEHVSLSLLSERSSVKPGDVFHLALKQTIAPDWHTYWRNPGDSGEPTDVSWTQPEGVEIGTIKWPAPKAIPYGPLVNYGFSNSVVLPFEVRIPASAKPGTVLTFEASATWLECADVCIPGEGRVTLSLPVGASQNSPDAPVIAQALNSLPKPFGGTAGLTDLGEGGLQLILKGTKISKPAYFFPYELEVGALIDFAKPQEFMQGKDGVGLTLVKSPSFPKDLKGPISGVLVMGEGEAARSYEVSATVAGAGAGETLAPAPVSIGLFAALGLAFLGGLILNLMPCVFPILSMKALGLLEASHGDKAEARAHGLWYGAGVLGSFLGLATLLIMLKSAGVAAGWGFQLQSPALVIGLAVLMVLISFNLLGFFEFGTSFQGAGASLTQRSGHQGSFFTGVLAVVVAAPCTAPFMGAALGYAATQSAPIALLVFASLGLGFAAPFVGLTFVPALMRALPRPGLWMVRLKEVMAFPMLATAIWLIWVVSAQAGQAGVLAALIAVLGAGFAVWIWSRYPTKLPRAVALAILALSVLWAGLHANTAQTANSANTVETAEAWSTQRVQQLTGEGKTVFVNFTADWCVTCKVNEVSVFNDREVKAALNGDSATYLVADWTNKNDLIAAELASHGRVGVPLYLVYKPGQQTPTILPQLLTRDVVLGALK